MFEHNWLGREYERCEEVWMFGMWNRYVGVENCILNINYWFVMCWALLWKFWWGKSLE
jgi:hypothetical protein